MENINDTLSQLNEKIKEMTVFQDIRDTASVLKLSGEILSSIDAIQNFDQLNKQAKAKLTYYKGRALAAADIYEKAAEENLSRSIKLDPFNSEAWSWLGEVFYLKKDYVQSKRCFEGSLEQSGPNKETLRKLSIVYRFLNSPEERSESVLKSIEIAKQALNLDLLDGESWYILANAQLTNFFTNSPSYEELGRSLKSYSQALKFSNSFNPDLHFNRALAFNAGEMYKEALDELSIVENDPMLNAAQKAGEIVENLRSIAGLIEKKCDAKRSVVKNFCKKIPNVLKSEERFKIVPLSELQEGVNENKMLSLAVLGYSKSDFPPVFVGCDFLGEFFAISIYNASSATRIIKGNIAFIRNPVLLKVSVKDINYPSIQIRDPNTFMISH